jgi:UTP-glucose-1-phosphate uridylyltransferase
LHTVVEKPAIAFAQAHLGINNKQYAVFMYALTPAVYKILEQQFNNGKIERGELQLTPALDEMVKASGAYGLLVDGRRFDVGLPEEYRKTVAGFAKW